MTKIYSKTHPEKLLHQIVRKQDIPQGRTNLCEPDQFLQCAALRLEKGTTFKAHQHIWHRFNGDRIPQEAWACIKGSVKVFFYDLDGSLLHTDIIVAGELSQTWEGGHNYLILEDETMCWEFKVGPYINQEHDKVFL